MYCLYVFYSLLLDGTSFHITGWGSVFLLSGHLSIFSLLGEQVNNKEITRKVTVSDGPFTATHSDSWVPTVPTLRFYPQAGPAYYRICASFVCVMSNKIFVFLRVLFTSLCLAAWICFFWGSYGYLLSLISLTMEALTVAKPPQRRQNSGGTKSPIGCYTLLK